MTAKLFVFVAFLALARAGPAPQSDCSSVFTNILEQADGIHRKFVETLNATANSPSARNVQGALEQGTQSVLQQFTRLATDLQAAATNASGKGREVLNEAVTSLQRTTEDLRRQHPEVEQQSAELSRKLQAAVQNAASETGRLAQEFGRNVEANNQQLAPQISKAFDDFFKQTQAVATNLHQAVTRQ